MLGCNSEAYSKCRISSYNNTGVQIVSPNTNWDFYLIKTVTDTNQSFNLTFYAKSSETGNYAETVYTITVQDDRFLPILEDTVFHANVDYLILLDLI